MIALIDGDLIAHRCAVALDEPMERVEEGLYRFDETEACNNARAFCERILEEVGATRGIITFTDKDNYRKDVLPTYKGNRKQRKPILFKAVRASLIDWGMLEWVHYDRLEADDIMGILHTGEFRGDSVICSADKDMLTIPGLHYNIFDDPNPFGANIVEQSQDAADRQFYVQCISGDRTDGYPGAPGYGAIRSQRALDPSKRIDHKDAWEVVLDCYNGDTEEALINARCARILRAEDYNLNTGEVSLWTPEIGV